MNRRPVRAYSLLEVLLAASLMFLALAIVVDLLIPLMRYAALGSARADLVQMACFVSQKIGADLQTAPLEGLTLPSKGPVSLLAIQGLTSVTDTGNPVWSQQLVLYRWDSASGNLKRRLWPPGPPNLTVVSDAPLRLTLTQMVTAWGTPNGSERLLIQGIMSQFSLSLSPSTSRLPLHLHFRLQEAVPGREPQTYSHDQDIYLRAGS